MTKTIIIAEVGVNHNGNFIEAKKYIDACKKINVDIIKFQIAIPENVIIQNTKKARYQKKNSKDKETQFDMIKRLHLTLSEYKKLIEYSKKKKIEIMFSAFDEESLNFIIKNSSIEKIKIPSGEITNKPYLKILSKSKKTLILSTGMSNHKEIDDALKLLNKKNIILMHCTSSYPTNFNEVNLNVISTFKKKYNLRIGYSDHTNGFEVPIAAVSLGAECIEKHITFNRNMSGPDHKASMNIKDFEKMISLIRNIEKAKGSFNKKLTKSEMLIKNVVRKSIFTKKSIKRGEIFTNDNLCIKRPGYGVSPMKIDNYLGKKAKRNYKQNERIK